MSRRGGSNDAGQGATSVWKLAANERKAAIDGGNLPVNTRTQAIDELQRAMNMPQVPVNGGRTAVNISDRAIVV